MLKLLKTPLLILFQEHPCILIKASSAVATLTMEHFEMSMRFESQMRGGFVCFRIGTGESKQCWAGFKDELRDKRLKGHRRCFDFNSLSVDSAFSLKTKRKQKTRLRSNEKLLRELSYILRNEIKYFIRI